MTYVRQCVKLRVRNAGGREYKLELGLYEEVWGRKSAGVYGTMPACQTWIGQTIRVDGAEVKIVRILYNPRSR